MLLFNQFLMSSKQCHYTKIMSSIADEREVDFLLGNDLSVNQIVTGSV